MNPDDEQESRWNRAAWAVFWLIVGVLGYLWLVFALHEQSVGDESKLPVRNEFSL